MSIHKDMSLAIVTLHDGRYQIIYIGGATDTLPSTLVAASEPMNEMQLRSYAHDMRQLAAKIDHIASFVPCL